MYTFTAIAKRWFDKVNGNTYHSVRIINNETKESIVSSEMVYGYGEQYRQTAIALLLDNNWIDQKYKDIKWLYERENEYPILWTVSDGSKKEMTNLVL